MHEKAPWLFEAGGVSADVFHACSFNSAGELGRLWTQTAVLAGWGANTQVLGLSDGAEWIARLIEICFGRGARHLIDLFHVCEYLAAASPAGDEKSRRRWLRKQKKRLLAGKLNLVLDELRPRCEAPALADGEAPVRVALRYLQKRMEKLDYPFAVKNDLSVGSGLIEGAHRHLIQKRLKISGAWWLKENADDLAQLRVVRIAPAADPGRHPAWGALAGGVREIATDFDEPMGEDDRDEADQIMAATARILDLTLITRDERLRRHKGIRSLW